MNLSSNGYTIQGIEVTKIAAQFGTPVYVYDAEKIAEQISKLKQAFADTNIKIKYAAKALTNISILKLIRQEGAGIEVVSPEEGQLALHAGFKPSDIMFTPSGVDFSEIEECVNAGFGINLDSLSLLEKFGRRFSDQYPCAIRLNPHILAGGNIKISTGHINSKFGISIEYLEPIKEAVKKYNINVIGLHIHTGSDITDPDVFIKMADVLFSAAKNFESLQFIDFGSGFKVAYKEADAVTDIAVLGKKLSGAFNDFCNAYGKSLELYIEPGKFVVSESGVLLVNVNVVKPSPSKIFVGVNSGLNHLIRPMMYDAYHEIINVSNPQAPQKTYTVVGYICETDTFGTDRNLNEVREGDILAFKNAGAYGYSMSSNYNSRLRPSEVLVIKGEAKLIREREKLEDLLKRQILIDF